MRIALIGGSNCIIRDGFGARLSALLKDHEVVNFSLGASPSLRGLSQLYTDDFEPAAWDRIIFEYTLNDLIFETQNLISPIWHRRWMEKLRDFNNQYNNLFIVTFPGLGSINRLRSGNSPVYRNYLWAMKEAGIPGFDALTTLNETKSPARSDESLFKDNDHLTDDIAEIVARQCVAQLLTERAEKNSPANPFPSPLHHAKDFISSDAKAVTSIKLETSIVRERLFRLVPDMSLQVVSPGGWLAGLYTSGSEAGGPVLISTPQQRLVKNLQDQFSFTHGERLYYLRPLGQPLRTERGDVVSIRLIEDWYVPDALYDHTMAARSPRVPFIERHLNIGLMVFLDDK